MVQRSFQEGRYENMKTPREHKTDESSESLRDALKSGSTSKPKTGKKLKKFSKALRKNDPTQDRPSRLKK